MSQVRARLAPLHEIRVRVMDLEHDYEAIRELLRAGARDEIIAFVGATPRSMPLALRAARAGCVLGVLPRGATSRDLSRVMSRGPADRAEAFRDIARIFASESKRHPR